MTAVHAVWAVVWGATWGNNLASVEIGPAFALFAYLGRDHLGRRLAAWWAKHYGPHAVDHHRAALWQVLHEHDSKRAPK